MKARTRDIIFLAAGLAVLLAAVIGGYSVVRARAAGSGASQSLAPVPSPTPGASGAPAPQYERWTVGKAAGRWSSTRSASTSAPVKTQLGKLNQNGYPMLVLVDSIKGRGRQGLVQRLGARCAPTGRAAGSPRTSSPSTPPPSKIIIDLSERKLYVYKRRGEGIAKYSVAVGRPGLSARPRASTTSTQKLKPSTTRTGCTECWRSASARSSPSLRLASRAVRSRSTGPTSRGSSARRSATGACA